MRERILGVSVAVLMAVAACAQTPTPSELRLADGTEVQLRSIETVSSAHARVGDKVHFQVMSDVRVDGVTVIPRGSSALATVTVAQRKRRLGRAGQLNLNLGWVSLGDGERAPLRADESSAGESNSDTVVGGVAVSALFFPPTAPVFLLMHGQDTTMPEGTEFTAYIAGDVYLDPAKFPPPMDYRPTPGVAPAQPNRAYPSSITLPKK
jgi:hypothetical protein